MTLSKPKEYRKTCKHCGEKFKPAMTTQKVCSVACAIAAAPAGREKAQKVLANHRKQEHKAAKERVKTKAEHTREAQAAVNRYVRLRDASLGCVSCNKPSSWKGQWHASHLRSVGSSGALRFNLWNIHKSCSVCNAHLSGNLSEYLPRVRKKIGSEKVDWLYMQNEPRRFDIQYLKRIKAIFTKKARILERRALGS